MSHNRQILTKSKLLLLDSLKHHLSPQHHGQGLQSPVVLEKAQLLQLQLRPIALHHWNFQFPHWTSRLAMNACEDGSWVDLASPVQEDDNDPSAPIILDSGSDVSLLPARFLADEGSDATHVFRIYIYILLLVFRPTGPALRPGPPARPSDPSPARPNSPAKNFGPAPARPYNFGAFRSAPCAWHGIRRRSVHRRAHRVDAATFHVSAFCSRFFSPYCASFLFCLGASSRIGLRPPRTCSRTTLRQRGVTHVPLIGAGHAFSTFFVRSVTCCARCLAAAAAMYPIPRTPCHLCYM